MCVFVRRLGEISAVFRITMALLRPHEVMKVGGVRAIFIAMTLRGRGVTAQARAAGGGFQEPVCYENSSSSSRIVLPAKAGTQGSRGAAHARHVHLPTGSQRPIFITSCGLNKAIVIQKCPLNSQSGITSTNKDTSYATTTQCGARHRHSREKRPLHNCLITQRSLTSRRPERSRMVWVRGAGVLWRDAQKVLPE